MNSFFTTLKKYSKESATYILYATSLFCLLYYVGNFGGGFLSVIGNLFLMLVEISLWLLMPILLSTGKQDMAKSALRPIFTFWLVYTVFTYLTDCTQIAPGWSSDTTIAMGVFELLLACAFIVIAVLTVFASLKKDRKLKRIAFLIFAGALVFYLVLFSLRVAVYAEDGMGWSGYFEAIYKYLTLPIGMFFLVQHFEFTLDDMQIFEVKEAPAESAPAEEATAMPDFEDPAEEAAPVEETAAPAEETAPAEEVPAESLEEAPTDGEDK